MAEVSVHEWMDSEQVGTDMDWEEESYRLGCAYARELAESQLKALDDRLMRMRPKGLRLLGFRTRTIVTRFGEVTIGRRMYRDRSGETLFALDEYLGWKAQQQASASITESMVEMATEMPFRRVVETVSKLTAGVLSPMSAHRLLSAAVDDALDEERQRVEACFERGEDVCAGVQQVDVLYTEADGVWIHTQREERRSYEIRSGTAYSGWRRVGEDRYELVDKRVYCHASDDMAFWEGASLEWGKQYALDEVKLLVVGGDGANWIRSGVQLFGRAVFQLDGFHLSRACGRGYGKQLGSAIYDAIRSGSHRYARALMSAAEPAETPTASRDREYVHSNVTTGMDWRNRICNTPAHARSLGTMESNGDKLIARRMKKRGMSWTIRGAKRMAKAVQLSRNAELSRFCHRRQSHRQLQTGTPPKTRSRYIPRTRASDWTQASVPALSGPHNSRPWTTGLRRLLRTAY